MALTNYTDLIASIGDWLGRTDMAVIAPDLIKIAEQELDDRLRVKEQETRFEFQITSQFQQLPTDFLEARELKVISNVLVPLQYKTPQVLDDLRQRGMTDNSNFFTIRGTELQTSGAPSFIASQTVVSLTSVGTTATLTTAAAHGLTVGDSITVSGANEVEYNGTFLVVTVPTTTDFTYTTLTTPSGSPATGTIVYVVNNAELTYYKKITPLTALNLTNTIMTNYPSLYLYGCLKEAGAWIESSDILQGYMNKFEEVLTRANDRTVRALYTGSQLELTPLISYADGG